MDTADRDAPSCPNCCWFVAGPRRGRLFFRCLPCALRARDIRNAQKEAPRGT